MEHTEKGKNGLTGVFSFGGSVYPKAETQVSQSTITIDQNFPIAAGLYQTWKETSRGVPMSEALKEIFRKMQVPGISQLDQVKLSQAGVALIVQADADNKKAFFSAVYENLGLNPNKGSK